MSHMRSPQGGPSSRGLLGSGSEGLSQPRAGGPSPGPLLLEVTVEAHPLAAEWKEDSRGGWSPVRLPAPGPGPPTGVVGGRCFSIPDEASAARGQSLCGRCVPVRAGRGPPRPPGRRGQRGSQDGWLGGACVPSSARSRSDPHTATPRPGRGSPGQEGGCSTCRLSPSPHSGCPQRPTAPRGAVRGGVAPAPARTPHPPSPVPSGGESGLEAGGGRGFPPWPCRAGGWEAYAACVSSRL